MKRLSKLLPIVAVTVSGCFNPNSSDDMDALVAITVIALFIGVALFADAVTKGDKSVAKAFMVIFAIGFFLFFLFSM